MSADLTTKTLTLYYFSDDTIRMGSKGDFIIGIDPSNADAIYQGTINPRFAGDKLVLFSETGYSIRPDLILHRNLNLNGKSYITKRRIGCLNLGIFVADEGTAAGLENWDRGNWGYCVGTHKIFVRETPSPSDSDRFVGAGS